MYLKLSLMLWLMALKNFAIGDDCVNMWDANPTDTNICPVSTTLGTTCSFPFTRYGNNYHTCTAQWENYPMCYDSNNQWLRCAVPMDAVILSVSTSKSVYTNVASSNGGTMIWITGYRFPPLLFSTMPTNQSTVQIYLVGNFASYGCEIHQDKCTDTLLTCFTSAMPIGSYLVRVVANGDYVPLYQYNWIHNSYIYVSDSNTPKITQITPSTNIPNSFVTITGDFKTACGSTDNSVNYDNSNCALDTTPIIQRIYFGGQKCQLYDPVSNQLYSNLTRYSLYCLLNRPEVNYYNASMLVSNQFGRSLVSPSEFFVAPNDTLYNYQTFAEVNSIGPQTGSTAGGTFVSIDGLYFYTDINVPANIEIGGQPCNIVNFDMTNLPNTRFVCSSPAQTTANEYYGNRGVTLIVDDVYSSDLTTATPSAYSNTSVITQAAFSTSQTNDLTVWLKGFISPQTDSDYDFTLQTNGQAILNISSDSTSANQNQVATQSSSSNKVFLRANQNYFFMAVASKQGGGLNLAINARMYQTSLTSQYSSNVLNAQQQITISSTVNYETYQIDYSNLNASSGQSEIQDILIEGDSSAFFVLKFEGVTTNLIKVGAPAQYVEDALNNLPILAPNLVSVNESLANDNVSLIYSIQFSSSLGDVPDIEEILGLVNFTQNETVKGQPSGSQIQLNIQGAVTNLFDITNNSDAYSAIFQSFGIRCPSSVLSGPYVLQTYDYENCGYGSNLLNQTAFCGKCSQINNGWLFWNYNTANKIQNNFQYICFAYKSDVSFSGAQFYTFNTTTRNYQWFSGKYNFKGDFNWHYDCIDVSSLIDMQKGDVFVHGVYLYLPSNSQFYVDAITLRSQMPFAYNDPLLSSTRRLYPSLQMNIYTLNIHISNQILTFSFLPVNCTYNLLPITISQDLPSIVMTRTLTASPPVTGTFTLNWTNSLIPDISSQVSAQYLKVLLQQQNGLGSVMVDRSQTCYGYSWDIKWASGGYKAPLLVSSTNLNGDSPRLSTRVIQNGYAMFNPIRDDMLRTYHTVPQVTVSVDTIMSKCAGNCDFEWDLSATPTVTSINTTNLNAIIINGNGFDTKPENNLVQLGGINCTCSQATSTQLTCATGQNPYGVYYFTVNVLGKGLAIMNDNPSVTIQLEATSIRPLSSGTGGGAFLNVTGIGFNSNTTVSIDGNNCPVVFFSYSLLTCQIPPNPTQTNKTVDVEVQQGSTNVTVPEQFTYDYSSTVIISSISPSVLSVLGNQNVTITGTNLPINPINAKIGDQIVNFVSSTSTSLVIQSPAMAPGLYDFILPIGDLGIAFSNMQIEYKLYVSSLRPNIGSIKGGTLVTVYGDGFSTNCTQNQVSFGPSNCKITDCSETWIQCQTSSAYITYNVDNSASDPYYGRGYAWSQAYLEINVGDTVDWSWKPPTGITRVAYQVVQVKDSDSYSPIGFTSGPPTAVGSFEYQFNQAGTYYYWSGSVESTGQIEFRGVVVVSSFLDVQQELNVKVNGLTAQKCSFPFTYNSSVYNACTNIDFNYNWCSPTSTYSGQSLKCDPINQPQSNTCQSSSLNCDVTMPTSIYKMLFTNCGNQLPSIQSVSTDSPTFDTQITVTGIGFSSTECENQVLIGDVLCPLVNSSSTQLVCKLADNCTQLKADVPYTVNVIVSNIGFATFTNTSEVTFSAIVTSIYPTIGSINGGTEITIMGYGFSQTSTFVQIGYDQNVPYYFYYHNDKNNTKVTFNKITFTTIPLAEGTYDVKVFTNNVQMKFLNPANYTFSQAITPLLNSSSPLNVNSSSVVTLIGDNFGTDLANLVITIGTQICQPLAVNNTEITCQLNGLNLGDQNVKLNIIGVGNSVSSNPIQITGLPSISQISPSSGSIYGGQTLTINGNGFDNTTTVSIDNIKCIIISFSINELTCLTGAHSASANLNFQISTSSTAYSTDGFNYTYDSTLSPNITSITPYSGSSGNNTLTISGSGFGTNSSVAKVSIGNSSCEIISINDTEIECDLSQNGAGNYPVIVKIDNNGVSNNDKLFKFELIITSLSNSNGSVGGGLTLVINGQGFTQNSSVTICGKQCKITKISLTSITCLTPSASNTTADTQCSLILSENGLTETSSFTYLVSLTPKLSSVSPLRGGTGGGTPLTITGSNFFVTDKTQVNVTIGDSICVVQYITSTQIQCITSGYSYSSVKALVQVFILNNGYALNDGTVQFQYIDLWSSKWTWGGMDPPGEGELAVVGPGQIIYFDAATTPQLKGIIIEGGSLIFDDNQDVSLNVEYLIIVNGGLLQIGTKDNPFQHKAVITMFGSCRSIELPIFGSKVIGVRNGTVDMHGKNVGVTWTYLGATSLNGSDTITLIEPVIWDIGSEIVIATTGDKFSQGQSEVLKIISKSSDNKTLTLNSPLQFTHLGEKRTVGTQKPVDVYVRAEVGLLTRNVVFQGNRDLSWAPYLNATACPDGYDPSEFAVQTCFLGRYGPELGSDQFGGTIMLNGDMRQPGEPESVIGRFSNVELFHVGQSYRLGRYPIHFHMNGDMPSSYVSECAIHESFNRATNIHASNYVTVERTVIYNIMGGAFFLEDGVEIGNTFENNLAILVKPSDSLQNEDITPAAFWATNPNNTYIGNTAAGCSHFGFWYRLKTTPDGPSYTPYYHPNLVSMGLFDNNTVHSTGRFGLWLFPGYTPTVNGWINGDMTPSLAVFTNFVSYSNDKGAEFDQSNNIQFKNFTIWDQYTTAIETQTIFGNQNTNSHYIPTFYNKVLGPVVVDSVIIGNSMGSTSYTQIGIIVPWDRGELFSNISFYNFPDTSSTALRPPIIIGRCVSLCGGWTSEFEKLYFENVMQRTTHRWDSDFIAYDRDGTLTGNSSGGVVVFNNPINVNNPSCHASPYFVNGVACPKTNYVRVGLTNGPNIPSFITDSRNNTLEAVVSCIRLTQIGNMFTLAVNQTYSLIYYTVALTTANAITYRSVFYSFYPGDYIIMKHPLSGRKPDKVYLINGWLATESNTTLDPSVNNNGDWFWDNKTRTLSYILINQGYTLQDYSVNLQAVICQFPGCITPIIKPTPATRFYNSRPEVFSLWGDNSTWELFNSSMPQDGDDVHIPTGFYMVVNSSLPKMNKFRIDGAVELDSSMDHYLEANMILLNGGQLIIGWEKDPILTAVTVNLTGELNDISTRRKRDLSANQVNDSQGFDSIGEKGIGVFGMLDIHGAPQIAVWTTLNQTLTAGSNTVHLIEPVSWQVNDTIVIGSTSFDAQQSETFIIASVSNDSLTITLQTNAQYDHIYYTETLPSGQIYQIAAPVGLISHNVKIIGGEYPNQQIDQYGFIMNISQYIYYNGSYNNLNGFIRVSNVDFIRIGNGQLDNMQCGHGMQFTGLGSNNISYLINSSFIDGFGCAIGVETTSEVLIQNNVIYHTNGRFPFIVNGNSNILRQNLIIGAGSGFSSSQYLGDSIVGEDNFLVGTDFFYKGDICLNMSSPLAPGLKHSIKNNTIYGATVHINGLDKMYPTYNSWPCIRMHSFTVFKAPVAALTYKEYASLVIDLNAIIDSQIGIYTLVMAPVSTTHVVGNKTVLIQNNLIVGQSPDYNCSEDSLITVSEHDYNSIGAGSKFNSKIGIVWSQFMDNYRALWSPGWAFVTDYNAIGGLMIVKNVTFAYFDMNCKQSYDAVIATSSHNDDGQHPVNFQSIVLNYVNNASKVWIHRPNASAINPSQCVDMDCDGLKKELLTDLDGSFLGSPGTVISQSEFQWGSQRRGLGDFRIPREALSYKNGTYMAPSKLYKHRGIVRDESSCIYQPNWQAYECHGLEHKILIIESMDNDTETRRLSPVAILSDTGYLDLINGPSFHLWCSGYICGLRVSTFLTIIAANHSFDVYLTATPPTQLRFRVLNADPLFKAVITMYYFTSQRIDLYMNDSFVNATNAFWTNPDGRMRMADPSKNLSSYMPTVNSPVGTNLYYKGDNKMHFTIDGSTYIDLKISPVLFIRFGFPAITQADFYNLETLSGNMASILGVSPSKIRYVNIVRQTSSSGKKKRQSDDGFAYIEIEIYSDPVTSLNDSASAQGIQSELNNLTTKIQNLYFTGQLQADASLFFNVTMSSMGVIPANVSAPGTKTVISIVKIVSIRVLQNAAQCHALVPCFVQPILQVVGSDGNVVTALSSWTIQAFLTNSTNPNATLMYQTQATVVNGYANFTNLTISDSSASFVVSYKFLVPDGVNSSNFNSFNMSAQPFAVAKPAFNCINDNSNIYTTENDLFNLIFTLNDSSTLNPIPSLTWMNYTWQAAISIYSMSRYPPNGSLVTSNVSILFDPYSGITYFKGLSISKNGMYLLSVNIYSTGGQFNSQCYSNPITVYKSHSYLNNTNAPNVELKYASTNSSALGISNEKNQMQAAIFNHLSDKNITVSNLTLTASLSSRRRRDTAVLETSSGTVIVVFYTPSSGQTLESILTSMSISDYTVLTSIKVNGVEIYSSKKSSASSSSSDAISIAVLVGCVIGGAFFIGVLVLGYIGINYLKKIQKKNRVISPECWNDNGRAQSSLPPYSRPSSAKSVHQAVNEENI